MSGRRCAAWLGAMVVSYTALFTWFAYRRTYSYRVGEWDLGTIDQGFFTATHLGLPFYSTYEGMSHFGFHCSPIYLLIVPLYALHPSTLTLSFAQAAALALGAVPVFLLGRDLVGPRTGLGLAAVYLLNFPLHGVNYHDVHETGFCVAPLLLALWGLRTGRRGALWTGALLGLSCREDFGVLAFGMGLLGLWWRRRAAHPGDGTFAAAAPVVGDCVGLMAAGIAWTWTAFAVVLPWFGEARGVLAINGDRFAHLGDGPLAWLLSPVRRPVAFWGSLLRDVSLSYVLGLLAPVGFLPLRAPAALLVMAPVLVMNLVSAFGGMHLFTSHYAGPLIPFVFCAAAEGAAVGMRRRGLSDAEGLRFLRPSLVLALLTMLLFDPSPLRVGWKVKPIDAHARTLDAIVQSLPPDASVCTLPNIWPHLTHRLGAWPIYHEGTDYIVIDTAPESAAFLRESGIDVALPPLLARGAYVKVREDDGVVVYRKATPGRP